MYLRVNEGSRSRHRCSAVLSNFIISWNVSETETKFIDNNGPRMAAAGTKGRGRTVGKGPGKGGERSGKKGGKWKVEGRTDECGGFS